MGMIGYYAAVENDVIEKIAGGEITLGEDFDLEDCEQLDVDKSWQALHYLLCGGEIDNGEPPLGYVVPMQNDRMTEYGEYGSFYLDNGQVKEALAAIAPLTKERLQDRYDIKAMIEDQVYPVMDDEDADEFFDYIAGYFENIKEFYQKTAAAGQGIVFFVE